MRNFAFAALYTVCLLVFFMLQSGKEETGAQTINSHRDSRFSATDVSLRFVSRPAAEEHVIMPDWPIRLPKAEPDPLPNVGKANAKVVVNSPRFTAAMTGVERNRRRITGNRLALRTGPGTGHSVMASLARGEVGEILGGARDGWVPIRIIRTGQQGWVYHRYLGPV